MSRKIGSKVDIVEMFGNSSFGHYVCTTHTTKECNTLKKIIERYKQKPINGIDSDKVKAFYANRK